MSAQQPTENKGLGAGEPARRATGGVVRGSYAKGCRPNGGPAGNTEHRRRLQGGEETKRRAYRELAPLIVTVEPVDHSPTAARGKALLPPWYQPVGLRNGLRPVELHS